MQRCNPYHQFLGSVIGKVADGSEVHLQECLFLGKNVVSTTSGGRERRGRGGEGVLHVTCVDGLVSVAKFGTL